MEETITNNSELLSYIYTNAESIKYNIPSEAKSLADANAGQDQIKISELALIGAYEEILVYVRQSYQEEEAKKQFDDKRANEDNKTLDAELSEAKEAKRIAEGERKGHKVRFNWATYVFYAMMEVVGFVAEASYNVQSFTVGGGNVLFAIVPAFVAAVSLSVIAIHLGTSIKGKPAHEKVKIIRSFSWLMLIVFAALALLRSFSVTNGGTVAFSTETIVTALAFVVIQALIFGGATIVAMQFPNAEERFAKSEFDRLSKEIKKAEKKIAECQKNSKNVTHESDAKRRGRSDLAGEQAQCEALVENLCRQALSLFYKELSWRKPNMKFDHSALTMPLFQNNKNQQS
ncbi:MAG: hypothetical protein JSS76_04670 [Bacteroidetes bacterium]|nr:hypothetical protein [Bacteroidota bacterium]